MFGSMQYFLYLMQQFMHFAFRCMKNNMRDFLCDYFNMLIPSTAKSLGVKMPDLNHSKI